MGWLNDLARPNLARAALWTLLALIILVIVLIVIRIVKSMTFGTFVAGGRNRKTRLAVMDAAAVDSQRRLVLVRRDDVEHLILIGGPTDVVVERDIKLHQMARRPAPAGEPPPASQRQAGAPVPGRQEQRPAQPVKHEPRQPQTAAQTTPPPPVAAKVAPVRTPATATEPHYFATP